MTVAVAEETGISQSVAKGVAASRSLFRQICDKRRIKIM